MLNQAQKIKNKIFEKGRENNVLDIWHYLMVHYGWIPFNEFKKLDSGIVDELIIRLNKMNKDSKESFDKPGRRR